MNKSELVQKVVEAGIVPEADAVKLTKKMLTELLNTAKEEPVVEEAVVETVEEAVVETVEEVVEPVVEEVIEEPTIGLVSEVIVEEGVTKVIAAEPVVKKVLPQKQTKFKVILKNELPLVRIPTRMYESLIKGVNHKNIKELEIIFNTYGEFIVQDIDRVKKRSLVSFVDGKIVLK